MISYLTDEQHIDRMARAIYLASSRRERTIMRGFDTIPDAAQAGFRDLAAKAIAGADAMRAQAFADVLPPA